MNCNWEDEAGRISTKMHGSPTRRYGFLLRKNLAKGDITLMTTHDEDKYEKKIGKTKPTKSICGRCKVYDLGDTIITALAQLPYERQIPHRCKWHYTDYADDEH